MRRIILIQKQDKKTLQRLSKKNKTKTHEELHRILSYYFYVANTRKRLDLPKKAKRPKIIKGKFLY